jgi:tetratricopeptide (TPR) repeat protein
MNRKRRWQSAQDRARVAADLIAEAESLTEEAALASPAEVAREHLPPPVPLTRPLDAASAPAAPPPAPPPPPPRRSEDPEAALMELNAALLEHPDDATLLLHRARLHVGAGNFVGAQHDLEAMLRATPDDVDALCALGVVLARKGLWGEAAARLRGCVERDPGRGMTWYYLGEALNKLDDLPGALAAFERAVELQPEHARTLHALGVVLDRLRRPEDATRMYRRAREAASR